MGPCADLEEDITPAAVHRALAARQPLRALLLALRLNDPALISRAILACPLAEVAPVAQGVPPAVVPRLLATLAEMLSGSPHLEFLLLWARALSVAHGEALRSMPRHVTSGPLRALQRAVQSVSPRSLGDDGACPHAFLRSLRSGIPCHPCFLRQPRVTAVFVSAAVARRPPAHL